MRVVGRAWVVLVGACSFHPGVGAEGTDGRPVDEGMVDPDVPGVSSCMTKWRSGTVTLTPPTQILELSTTSIERDPWLSPDELRIYWSTDRSPAASNRGDIWSAARATLSSPFTNLAQVQSLSGAANDESKVSITGDGLVLAIASDAAGGSGSDDVWLATRATDAGTSWPATWSNLQVMAINDGGIQLDPVLTADGLRLYYSTGPVASRHIAMSARTSRVLAFGTPQTLIESGSGDGDPALSADELVIVFSSQRNGTNGGSDIWYASRSDPAAPFGPATHAPTINSSNTDGDPHLSADGCRLYFSSDRSDDYDLYVTTVQ